MQVISSNGNEIPKNNYTYNSEGGALSRVRVNFSKFPLDLEERYFDKSYITDKILSCTLPDYDLRYDEDYFSYGTKQLVSNNILEECCSNNSITFTILLDPYKRNYFMLLEIILATLNRARNYKETQTSKGKNRKPLDTIIELEIPQITIDYLDDSGNPITMMSMTYHNCYLKDLSSIELGPKVINGTFTASFIYEHFNINYDRMQTLEITEKHYKKDTTKL